MKHSNSRVNIENFQGKALLREMTILTFTMIFFQQHKLCSWSTLCLMVQVNLRSRSGNTCFLLVYFEKKKTKNLQSKVRNCDFNCCEVSLFPSAPLHPLAAITLSPSHPGRIPSATKPHGTITARCSFHPMVYPRPWKAVCASVLIWIHLWSPQPPAPQHPPARRLQSQWPQEPVLVFRRNETQNQKSFLQPFISLLLPLIIRHNHWRGAAPSPWDSYPEAIWT